MKSYVLSNPIFYASNNGHDLLGQFLCKYGDDMYIIYGSK